MPIAFPHSPFPYEDDQREDRPDICIGTDPTHTTDGVRDVAIRMFESVGWTVAVNRPFAGALVPIRFYGKDRRVRALMIEVNRRLYMDELTGEKLPGFTEVGEQVRRVVAALAAMNLDAG